MTSAGLRRAVSDPFGALRGLQLSKGQGRLLIVGAALVVAVGAGGYLAGKSAAEQADWHTGTGRVLGDPEDPDLVVDVDGWDYAGSGDMRWIDEYGTSHSGDTWPECLEPVPLTSRDFGAERTVRFATVKIEVDGMGFRPIVMVDCRG